MGYLLGELGSGAHLLGALKVMKGRESLMAAQLGNLECALLPGNLGDG
jgi:hypothetical protein